MRVVPTFKCPYCAKETTSEVDFSGEMPTGTMQLCDCPQFRAVWEADHRAKMERKKIAQRSGARSSSIIHVGRTPMPTGRKHRG